MTSTTSLAERSTSACVEGTPYCRLDLDAGAVEDAIQFMRDSLSRCEGNPWIANSLPASLTPQARSRSAHFDFLLSAIVYNNLDRATKQAQNGSLAMCKALASICAAIARTSKERSTLIQAALESIPFSIKEAFGSPPWSWQAEGILKRQRKPV